MRSTVKRLEHLSEASLAAAKQFGDTGWLQDETQAIALASAMIDQVIYAREVREGGAEAHAVPLAVKTVEEHVTDRINEQKQWIADHGATLDGYVATYGAANDPEHFGDGGEAIYAADQEALRQLIQERARLRHPSHQVHKATPGADEQHCGVCGQAIKRVLGGQGPTHIHVDSGAVAAPNPPTGDQS